MNSTILTILLVKFFARFIGTLAADADQQRPDLSLINKAFFYYVATTLQEQGLRRAVGADLFDLTRNQYVVNINDYSVRIREHLAKNYFNVRILNRTYILMVLLKAGRRGLGLEELSEQIPSFIHEENLTTHLNDLIEAGIVAKSGLRGRQTGRRRGRQVSKRFFVIEPDMINVELTSSALAEVLYAMIFYMGSGGHYVPIYEIRKHFVAREGSLVSQEILSEALKQLLDDGRIEEAKGSDPRTFRCIEFVSTGKTEDSWNSSMLDHFHAITSAFSTKLQSQKEEDPGYPVGGSTYSFDIWEGHKYEQDVLGLLEKFRVETSALRKKVHSYNVAFDEKNEKSPPPSKVDERRVIAYAGIVTEEIVPQ